MQRFLLASAVLFSLGMSSADNSNGLSISNRLATLTLAHGEVDEMRRSEDSRGQPCSLKSGRIVPHGTVISAQSSNPCEQNICRDGTWTSTISARCQGVNSGDVVTRNPAAGAVTRPPRLEAAPEDSTAGAVTRPPRLEAAAASTTAAPEDGFSPFPVVVGPGSSFPEAAVVGTGSVECPLPTYKGGKWMCPDQSLTLEQRRTMFESMKPFDEINGVKLDDFWPATAGDTFPMATRYQYDYEGIDFKAYKLSRPTGERAPVHYHEVAQQLCLESGKIMVMTEGEPDKFYSAPDCYMMPAYTKVSVISLEEKVEHCLLRVPKGGLDWVVIEPKYYDIQGQWTDNVSDVVM